jgi:hypothetical protein
MKTKTKSNKLISYLIAIALVFGLFAAMPLTASADDISNVIDKLNGFNPGPWSAGRLKATDTGGNTVTVTGTVTDATEQLDLDIPSGITVIWKASYSGTTNSPFTMIQLSGTGTFVVADGGSVKNTGNSNTVYNDTEKSRIEVNGGEVISPYTAIYTRGDLDMSGGTVSSIVGYGNSPASVKIRGGTVSREIYVFNSCSLTVSGGTVNTGTGFAIRASGHPSVTVSGGTVSSTGNHAIYTHDNSPEIGRAHV